MDMYISKFLPEEYIYIRLPSKVTMLTNNAYISTMVMEKSL